MDRTGKSIRPLDIWQLKTIGPNQDLAVGHHSSPSTQQQHLWVTATPRKIQERNILLTSYWNSFNLPSASRWGLQTGPNLKPSPFQVTLSATSSSTAFHRRCASWSAWIPFCNRSLSPSSRVSQSLVTSCAKKRQMRRPETSCSNRRSIFLLTHTHVHGIHTCIVDVDLYTYIIYYIYTKKKCLTLTWLTPVLSISLLCEEHQLRSIRDVLSKAEISTGSYFYQDFGGALGGSFIGITMVCITMGF